MTSLAGVPAGALGEAYDRSSDLGMAVADVLGRANGDRRDRPVAGPPELGDVAAAFAAIEAASGPAAKGALFGELLARCDPLTAKYVVKILSGELRIGLREGLLEAAIARAFDRPIEAVKRAAMLTGDIGETAVARPGRRPGVRPACASSTRSSSCSRRRPRTPPRS